MLQHATPERRFYTNGGLRKLLRKSPQGKISVERDGRREERKKVIESNIILRERVKAALQYPNCGRRNTNPKTKRRGWWWMRYVFLVCEIQVPRSVSKFHILIRGQYRSIPHPHPHLHPISHLQPNYLHLHLDHTHFSHSQLLTGTPRVASPRGGQQHTSHLREIPPRKRDYNDRTPASDKTTMTLRTRLQ